MKRVMLCLAILLTIASPAAACIGARQAAMGWCGVAISDDATASYWNPAAIVWAKDGFFYGRDYIYPNISKVPPELLDYIDTSPRTGFNFAAKYNNWGFHYFNDDFIEYFRLSFGHLLTNEAAVGFNLGICKDKPYADPQWDYYTPSFDLSYIHKNGNFRFGILAQDIINIRPEIAYSTNIVTVAAGLYDFFDICKEFREDGNSLRDFHFGIELRPFSFAAFRAGFNSNNNKLIYGFGIENKYFGFDLMWRYEEQVYCSFSIFVP